MRQGLFFAIMALAFTMQACGDNPREIGELQNQDFFANDSTIIIKNESNKYVCDFQWTKGYRNWNYDFSGENPADSVEVIAPWCLIPYGRSTYYVVSISDTAKGNAIL